MDIKNLKTDNISVSGMVEVEYVEVKGGSTTVDTGTASNPSEKATNYSLLMSESKDDTSSDEEDENDEEASDNQVSSKRQRSSWKKRFQTESAKLEYNRQKASVQRERRQNLVEGIANLRASIGATKKDFKTCQKLVDHVVLTIPRAERHIARKQYRVSCLAQENLMLEEKIRKLELQKASARNMHEQEESP